MAQSRVAQKTVGEFARSILMLINAQENKNTGNLLADIESRISLFTLADELTPLQNSTEILSDKSVDVMFRFLKRRWNRIKYTDASYNLRPDSPINTVCIQLARELDPISSLVYLDILMPHPDGTKIMDFFPLETLDTLHLKRFMWRYTVRGATVPMLISEAFDRLENNRFDDKNPAFNAIELTYLVNYSQSAKAYHDAIEDKDSSTIASKKAQFLKELQKPDEITIGSSYQSVGNDKLMEYIFSKATRREELIPLLARFIDKSDWKKFIGMVDKNLFFKTMLNVDNGTDNLDAIEMKLDELLGPSGLGGLIPRSDLPLAHQEMQSILQNSSIENKELTIRAYLFCLLGAYAMLRDLEPEQTSRVSKSFVSVSSWFGLHKSAYVPSPVTKEEKLAACKMLESLIQGNNELSDVLSALTNMVRGHASGNARALRDGRLANYATIATAILPQARDAVNPQRSLCWRTLTTEQ